MKWFRFFLSLIVFSLLCFQSVFSAPSAQAAFLHNDKYAWFADNASDVTNPFCVAFQSLKGFDLLGVNIYELEEHPPEDLVEEMAYLETCGVTAIRTFGLEREEEVDNLVAVIQAYPQFKYIVALGNPANQVLGEGGTKRMYNLKGAWFADDPYGYEDFARMALGKLQAVSGNLAIVELANEPHCGGDASCVAPFNEWVIRMTGIASSLGVPVSFGGGFLDDTAAETTGNLAYLNRTLSNYLTSFHEYPEELDKSSLFSAAVSALGAQNMYVGELGFPCTGRTCKESTNDAERAQKFVEAANEFKAAGVNRVFLWIYSGFGVGGGGTFEPPTLITPEADVTEIRKYLANSQVYCAPNQAFVPDVQGNQPPLSLCIEHRNVSEQKNLLGGFPLAARISMNDDTCSSTEYPLIDANEQWDTELLSFPLWRNETGGVSIEADLSRVDPNSTFAEAAKENSRPEYAPQFYLTSPEMQCKNAVNHLSYVEKICQKYNTTEDPDACPLNSEVEFADGSISTILALRNELPNSSACSNISADMADPENKRGQAVRAISTQTPKAFKLGFFVQHTYMHEPVDATNRGPILKQWLGLEAVSTWFAKNFPPEPNQFPGEVVDTIPIWYNSGLALSAYDEYLQGSEGVRAYNYDPEALPRSTDPASLKPNALNFVSGWNQTYAAILPLSVQQKISAEIRNTVADTWAIMNALIGKLGWQSSVQADGITVDQPVIECVGKQCICYGDSSAVELKQQGVSDEYAGFVAQNCAAAEMADVASAFPSSFYVENSQNGRNFMYSLKEAIIQRVNAGVQKSVAFDETKVAPEDYRGPLGERSFTRCPVEEVEYGVQESAPLISSRASQPLPPPVAGAPDGLGSTGAGVAGLVRDFVAKIIPGAPEQEQFKQKKTSRAYLILPDEALTIEKTQSYVAPMFFSPEMYASIMSGKNPIYPFAEENNGEDLSAFMRADGLSYNLDSQPEGYAIYRVERVLYTAVPTGGSYTNPATGQVFQGCNLMNPRSVATGYLQDSSGTVGPEPVWIERGEYDEPEPASCAFPEQRIISEVQKSTVDLAKKPQENANPETPGQLAALNEFLRRMAFLPLHLVQKYSGLESFYAKGGVVDSGESGLDGEGDGSTEVQRECAYSKPRQISLASYPTLDSLRPTVCRAADQAGVSGALLRSILELEGSPLLRAILNHTGSYTCSANAYGAVGPMGNVVAQCSTRPVTSCSTEQLDACFAGGSCACIGFHLNRTKPDLCSPEGALTAGAELLKQKVDIYVSRNPGANMNSPHELAMAGEGFLGWGSCRDENLRFEEGQTAVWTDPSTGQKYDYCAYLERLLTNSFTVAGYCR